jgi:hypothetical protein
MQILHFENLREQGIVQTWAILNRWIDQRGFPPGRIIGRFRTWTVAEVMAYIEAQPTVKRPPTPRAKKLREDPEAAAEQTRIMRAARSRRASDKTEAA